MGGGLTQRFVSSNNDTRYASTLTNQPSPASPAPGAHLPLLQSPNGRALEAQIGSEVLRYFTNEALDSQYWCREQWAVVPGMGACE